MTPNVACVVLVVTIGAAAGAFAQSPDWMIDDQGVLELKLAQDEKDRPCGAVLRMDRNKRVLLYEGIPGEVGCKAKIEAVFGDVKSVTTGPQAGFTLELKTGKPRRLILIPVPHALWFAQQRQVRGGGLSQGMEGVDARGPDGGAVHVSGSAAGAPRLKKVDLPKPVVDDTKKAAAAIREVLGLN